MILTEKNELRNVLVEFHEYECILIIAKYNAGKSSIITDMICEFFGEPNTCYVTFIDQNKPNFLARKSTLSFGELVKNKVLIFDELSDDLDRDVHTYAKELLQNNKMIILTNPYGSSGNADNEIELFKKQEAELLPENTLFVFLK